MWIFGYGSLVWKADFPYEERVVGYIKGYVRRFWQASIDHRGVPENPGRVVTLVKSESPEDKVWGVVYKVNESVIKEGSTLQQREQRYTEKQILPVFTGEDLLVTDAALLFIGTKDQKLQLGPRPLKEMASQIACSQGPSGNNAEYLFKLANFLRDETPVIKENPDEVFQLEEIVKNLNIK